jgi:TRAP-type transport system periplasmic protein
MSSITRASALVLALFGIGSLSAQADEVRLRISLDTGPNHVRNITIERFAERLAEIAPDRFTVEIYPASQLFSDTDAVRALAQDNLEMAVPGLWQLGGFEPNALVLDLPMFYGTTAETVHAVIDGPIGDELKSRLSQRLLVEVIGDVLDLGHGSLFTTNRPIQTTADIEGLKIRTPPGAATLARYKVMGANPVAIPFGDVPLALTQNAVDGLFSSHETIRSAKLWEAGVSHAFDDFQAFLVYIPMVSQGFWGRLDAEAQEALVEAWADVVGDGRALAAERQAAAKAEGMQHGISAVDGDPADLRAMREKLLAAQDEVIRELGIDPDFAARVQEAVLAAEG